MNHLFKLILFIISVFNLSKGSSLDYKDSVRELKLKTRNLQFADEDLNIGAESQGSAQQSQESSTSFTGGRDSEIQLVGISNFKQVNTSLLTWIIYFIIINRKRPEIITFTVNINYRQLRNLQAPETQQVTCVFWKNNETFYAYNSSAPAIGNVLKVSSNNDFKFDGENINEMYTSYMTELSLQNIQNEDYDNLILIDNGKIIDVKKSSFSFKGNLVPINSLNFDPNKVDEIPFTFKDYNEITKSPEEVNCKVINKNIDDYRLRCYPDGDFEYNIHLSCGKVDNSKICLNMKENDVVGNKDNSTDFDVIPKTKSSGGLSKGAIAGIIIACVVLLIASAIIALLCRRNHSEPTGYPYSKTNNTSVVNVNQFK